MSTRYITRPLPPLPADLPPAFTKPHWIATVPGRALLHRARPGVTEIGTAMCPLCHRTLRDYEVTIQGRVFPRDNACSECHQAISWAGWEEHRAAEIARMQDAGTFIEDEDADEEDEEEPCICCGDDCDPNLHDGYCTPCYNQGCHPH